MSLVLTAPAVCPAELLPDRVLSQRLDQSLQVLCRVQQDPTAAERDRINARRLARLAQPQSPGLVQVLVQHTAGLDQLQEAGFLPQATIGRVTSGALPSARLPELARLPGVQHIQLSRSLNASGSASAAPPWSDHGSAPTDGTTATAFGGGAGVLVAFIDTGADIFHHDLRHDDGSTRVRFLLDLSQPGDVDGDGILDGDGPFGGTLYSQEEINDALAAGRFAHHDTTGHGTHGLSIAAGDNPELPGMAPAADLIVVAATREPGSLSITSSDMVNALAFIDARAAELGQPYVVNLSLGSQLGSHDGRSLAELAIDALVGAGKAGKAVVSAAGSTLADHDRFRHLSGTAPVGLATPHTLHIDHYTPAPQRGDDRVLLDLWWEGNDRLSITVTGPETCGAPEVTAAFGSLRDISTACGDVLIANLGGINPLNGDTEAIILVDDWSGTAPAPGTWTITLAGEEIRGTGRYQGWLAASRLGDTTPYLMDNPPGRAGGGCGGGGGSVRGGCEGNADNRSLVGTPGGARNAITVGSHAAHLALSRFSTTWTDVNRVLRSDGSVVSGDISSFSASGPTRDGRIKPELTAPGEWVLGAVSRDAFPGSSADSVFADDDALIVVDAADNALGMLRGSGCSAAVVTGLVARLLAADPGLDAVEIRNMLLNTAVTDSFTGVVPDPAWGHGKVNLGIGTSSTPLPSILRINAKQLPDGAVGRQYNHMLTASGGVRPYSWRLETGSPPPGLSLDTDGFLSGQPTTLGSFAFTIGISDGTLQSHTQGFVLTITDRAPLEISSTPDPVARVGQLYDSRVQAGGGTPPYTYTLAGGSLPEGLSLRSDGSIAGVATTPSSSQFTVMVADSAATLLRSMRISADTWTGDLWQQLGDSTSSVTKIAVDPGDPSRLFCVVPEVGVFASTDGGESWKNISANSDFPEATEVWDLAVSPLSGEVFATTGDSARKELLRWDEVLREWVSIAAPSSPSEGFRARIRFDPAGNLYAFESGVSGWSIASRLLASPDDGESWSILSGFFTGYKYQDISIFEDSPETMYLSSDRSIMLTLDGGGEWYDVSNETSSYYKRNIAVSQNDSFDVVALDDDCHLWRTADGGRNWDYVHLPSCAKQDLERSFSNPQLLLVADANNGLVRSEDGGNSWDVLDGGLTTEGVFDIELVSDDASHLVAGTTGGVSLTMDGGASWETKSTGLTILDLVAMDISRLDPQRLVLLSPSGPQISRNHGDTWVRSRIHTTYNNPSAPAFVELSPAMEDLVYVIYRGYLYRSEDLGITWVETSPDFNTASHFVVVAADPFDSELIVAAMEGSKGTYRSHDRGASWEAAYAGLPFAPPTDLVFAEDVEGRLYLSFSSLGVYRSDDRGTTWAEHGLNTETVTLVRPAPSSSEYLYAATEDATWFLDPSVGTWQQSTSSPANPVLCMAVDPSNLLVAYAGTDHPGTAGGTGGLYRTEDGGRTWTLRAGPLDAFDVISVVIDPSDPDTLFAATRHGGVYRSSNAGLDWTSLSDFGTVAGQVTATVRDPLSRDTLIVGTEGFGVQISGNGGDSFGPLVDGLGSLDVNIVYISPLCWDCQVVFAGTEAGLYQIPWSGPWGWTSTGLTGPVTDMVIDAGLGYFDGGYSSRLIWATVRGAGVGTSVGSIHEFSVSATGLLSLDLTGIAVEHLDGGGRRVWVSMRGGDGVACSYDLGQTWLSAAGSGLGDHNVNDIAVDPLEEGRIWVTTDSGVLYTEDAGTSWNQLSDGLPAGVPVSSVSIDPISGEVLVSLDDESLGGVYRSSGPGDVWTELNAGLGQRKVGRLSNDGGWFEDGKASTTFFASTQGGGAWSATLEHPVLSQPVVSTDHLPDALVGQPYTAILIARGGIAPYSWSITSGSLPSPLQLTATTGMITGSQYNTSETGTWELTVEVEDRVGQIATAQLSFTRRSVDLFSDGFESGDTSAWSMAHAE